MLERSFKKASIYSDNLYRSMGGNYGSVAMSVGLYGIANGFLEIAKQAADAERTIAGFTPMMGSAEKAAELFREILKTTTTTPYEFKDLSTASKFLLPVSKGDVGENIRLIKMIGDVAGGSGESLAMIAKNYSQVMGMGKLHMKDLNEFTTYGIQVWDQLSKATGKSVTELKSMQDKGLVTGEMIARMFKNMTSEGGDYYNFMATSNKTLHGQWSNMKDTINMLAIEIGMTFLPLLKQYVKEATKIAYSVKEWTVANKELVSRRISEYLKEIASWIRFLIRNFETIVTIFKIWVKTLIISRLATIALTIAIRAVSAATVVHNVLLGISAARIGYVTLAMRGNAVALATMNFLTKGAVIVQGLLNESALASSVSLAAATNIVLLSIVAVSAAAVAWYRYANSMSQWQEVSKRTSEITIDQEIEIKELFKTLKSTIAGSDEYREALEKIREISPEIVTAYDLQLGGLTRLIDAEKELIKLIKQRAIVQANMELAREHIKAGESIKQGTPNLLDYAKQLIFGSTSVYGPGVMNADVFKNQRAAEESAKSNYNYDRAEEERINLRNLESSISNKNAVDIYLNDPRLNGVERKKNNGVKVIQPSVSDSFNWNY